MDHRILILDDEPLIRLTLTEFLREKGYHTEEAELRSQAQEMLQSGDFDAAVIDYKLPDGNAMELLEWMKTTDTDVPVIILTSYNSVELAVQAIQEGAEHFLTKPVELPALEVILKRVLENRRNRRQRMIHRSRRSAAPPLDPFAGNSAGIRQLAAAAPKLAEADSPVLIQGETGSGKGVLARWLHEHGGRAEEPFTDINCAGLSPEFLESELFGHQRGAFTGAATNKPGLLEVAHRGTVFLDEIGDVDLRVQPMLLKVLEEKRFRRLGDVRERQVNVRLLAASHQDLSALVREKRFRSDLYFRINTLTIVIPPLRDRQEDIPVLADNILQHLAAQMGRPKPKLQPSAVKALQRYLWPGNIRELRNVLERAVLLSSSRELKPKDLNFEAAGPVEPEEREDELSLEQVERRHIERVLRHTRGAMSRSARILGISRSTLYQKVRTYGIEMSES